MAGAGYKLFNTGDVLTAAQVNTYLQEQAVMRFANATARTTALSGVLAEGMMSYLDDTNSVEVYNGSAWVSVGSTGDIEGVTAGVGISGGGTSGTVTITNSMATAIDAKGDLIVGTGADTFSRLAVGGTSGHVLTVDSGEATGMKWAAVASSTPTFVGVHLTNSADQTVSNATNKILDWDTETIDTDGFHSTTVNNSRITIPSGKAGKYLLVALVQFDPNATGTRYLELNKNGSIITGGAYGYTYNLNNGGYGTAFMSRIVDAAVNDYFQVYAWQNSGGNLLVQCDQYQSYFGMYLIGV